MSEIREEIVHVKGYPKKLIIFLHGYIDNAVSAESYLHNLVDNLDNVAIHIPEAPYICEIHEKKRQWYSMHRFDPNDDRKTVPSLEECIAIYDKMKPGLIEAEAYLSSYIEDVLSQYELGYSGLFLCGFSQGATLALYESLMLPEKIAGCISFSGMLAPHTYVLKHYQSKPDTLLIHGTNDNLVRFSALDFTNQCLKDIGVKTQISIINGGQHRISEQGVDTAVEFIKQRL